MQINCCVDSCTSLLVSAYDLSAAGIMVDDTYHAGTIRDVAAMNAASGTGYTMLNAQTGDKSNSTLTVHDFLTGLAQLRDVLDNTNEENSDSTDSVSLLTTCC